MTGDRHDKRAAMDFSMIIFAQTPSWLVWILTVMPVWLYFSSFLFCSILFLNSEHYILFECLLCLIFITVLLSLQSNWAWKSLKLGMSSLFFFKDFHICSRFNNVNYGAWYVYKPLFGCSVATCRLACSEISLSIIGKKLKRSPEKDRT